jgi:hypothetical protein
MFKRKQLINTARWVCKRLLYEPSDIKRAHITIIDEKIVNENQRHAKAPIRVNLSPIFHELGYRVNSSPALVAEHLPDAASRLGSIEFFNMQTGRFYVDWSQASSGELQCSISADLQPEDRGVIQEQTAPTVNLEFESRDACITKTLHTLCESKHILLRGVGAARLKVWISISREIFIGRSRFELNVHAELLNKHAMLMYWPGLGPNALRSRRRRMVQDPIPSFVGIDDMSQPLSHRQRNLPPSIKQEESEPQMNSLQGDG